MTNKPGKSVTSRGAELAHRASAISLCITVVQEDLFNLGFNIIMSRASSAHHKMLCEKTKAKKKNRTKKRKEKTGKTQHIKKEK